VVHIGEQPSVLFLLVDLMCHADFPPHYKSTSEGSVLSVPNTFPPPLSADSLAASGRDRIPPPLKPFDFLPDLLKETEKGYKPRTDVKPLHIVQPEGVSFKMNGHELEWQNWKMHIGDWLFPYQSTHIY
jgi:primary-amine oxidase